MKPYLLISIAFILTLGCTSAPPVQVKKDESPVLFDISLQNQQLENYSIGGFEYKSSNLDIAKWDQWAQKTAPVIKDIIGKLPDGYALQIIGHTDASGSEEPVGNKPGNIKISTDRAKSIYDALKKAGIDFPKIKYKGVGSDELLKGYEPKASEQRRVTFRIVSL